MRPASTSLKKSVKSVSPADTQPTSRTESAGLAPDGLIKEDKLGLDTIYVQAKRWQNLVHRPEVQKFAGALQGKRSRKGVFITTSAFSEGAIEYAAAIESRIVLIDGEQLALLMIDHGVGVATQKVYEVKRVDLDYFSEEV